MKRQYNEYMTKSYEQQVVNAITVAIIDIDSAYTKSTDLMIYFDETTSHALLLTISKTRLLTRLLYN